MKKVTGRASLLAVSIAGLVGLLVAVNAVPGGATSSSGQTSTTLARGTDQSALSLPLRQGTDIVVAQNTFAPGGSSGWHSHPGGAIGVVAQGEITIYRRDGDHCQATRYSAGQSFVERPGDVLDGVNTGASTTTVFVTFPSVPVGGATRIDQPDPGICPGL